MTCRMQTGRIVNKGFCVLKYWLYIYEMTRGMQMIWLGYCTERSAKIQNVLNG
jgi:hypothetical protein